MRVQVLEYYQLVRSILRSKPQLRRRLCRCRHCRIFFFTHARNAGRQDLRCPFGCREAHRKAQSTKRSVAYYQGEYGRIKKRIQNQKRGRPEPNALEPPPAPSAMIEHLRMVVSLIEERAVSGAEIVELAACAVMRQQSIGRRGRFDYLVRHLHENPP